jgi:hypothetical protein
VPCHCSRAVPDRSAELAASGCCDACWIDNGLSLGLISRRGTASEKLPGVRPARRAIPVPLLQLPFPHARNVARGASSCPAGESPCRAASADPRGVRRVPLPFPLTPLAPVKLPWRESPNLIDHKGLTRLYCSLVHICEPASPSAALRRERSHGTHHSIAPRRRILGHVAND